MESEQQLTKETKTRALGELLYTFNLLTDPRSLKIVANIAYDNPNKNELKKRLGVGDEINNYIMKLKLVHMIYQSESRRYHLTNFGCNVVDFLVETRKVIRNIPEESLSSEVIDMKKTLLEYLKELDSKNR